MQLMAAEIGKQKFMGLDQCCQKLNVKDRKDFLEYTIKYTINLSK